MLAAVQRWLKGARDDREVTADDALDQSLDYLQESMTTNRRVLRTDRRVRERRRTGDRRRVG